jgi:hypothetical protein
LLGIAGLPDLRATATLPLRGDLARAALPRVVLPPRAGGFDTVMVATGCHKYMASYMARIPDFVHLFADQGVYSQNAFAYPPGAGLAG